MIYYSCSCLLLVKTGFCALQWKLFSYIQKDCTIFMHTIFISILSCLNFKIFKVWAIVGIKINDRGTLTCFPEATRFFLCFWYIIIRLYMYIQYILFGQLEDLLYIWFLNLISFIAVGIFFGVTQIFSVIYIYSFEICVLFQ
jgi:hypothetical protein